MSPGWDIGGAMQFDCTDDYTNYLITYWHASVGDIELHHLLYALSNFSLTRFNALLSERQTHDSLFW